MSSNMPTFTISTMRRAGSVPVTRLGGLRWTPIPGASKTARVLSVVAWLLGIAPSPVLALPSGEPKMLALPISTGCPTEVVWLERVYVLVSQAELEDAIDLLFEQVDDLLLAGRFNDCDKILQKVDIDRLETNLMIGLLSVTLAAAKELPNRALVMSAIRESLTRSDPARVERLLNGLVEKESVTRG